MIAELKGLMGAGQTDYEAAESMNLDAKTYNSLKRQLYDEMKAELAGRPTEEVYADYVIQQQSCIRDLDDVIARFGDSAQVNGVVGALRAKSDILERVISMGQSFGIIEKIPEKKQIVGGFLVAQLDNAALRALITEQLNSLQQIVGHYGNADLFGNPIDEPKSLPAAPLAPQGANGQDTRHAPMAPPTFNAQGKPAQSIGGTKKAAGARAVNAIRRVTNGTVGGAGRP